MGPSCVGNVCYGRYLCSSSNVPSPFLPPVFDRLQYASTEGEGLSDLVTFSDVWCTQWGVVLMNDPKALSCNVHTRAGCRSVHKSGAIP